MGVSNIVINIAAAEVGYLEKASRTDLDDKTANAGTKNITKYARDLDELSWFNTPKQGAAWCAVFVTWAFWKAFGLVAKKMLFQPDVDNCAAGCNSARGYYNKHGRLYDAPEIGDQIFFWSSDMSKISHTGIVMKVDAERVYTIEGNTSDGTTVEANGGAVCAKNYQIGYSRIAGYGRPDWSVLPDDSVPNISHVPALYEATVYATNGYPVNLRASASTASNVLCKVPVGAKVGIIELTNAAWAKCVYQSIVGYMMREYLIDPALAPESDTVQIDRVKLLEVLACLNDSVTIVKAALEKGVGADG